MIMPFTQACPDATPRVPASRHLGRWLGAWLLLTLPLPSASAQFYRAGDIVEEFVLTDRDTRGPVSLSQFAGKILFLEWFAWWCPFCQAAAPQVESGIVQYYADREGNPDGIPVEHVAVNLQAGQDAQTENFINHAGFTQVLEDVDRAVARRFQSGGQPIFAIINGVADSPSHRQWELLLHQNGYGTTTSPIERFRAAIDAVKAPAPAPPRLTLIPALEPGTFGLHVESAWRRLHRVEVSPDLAAWASFAEFTPVADLNRLEAINVSGGAGMFYRVVVP